MSEIEKTISYFDGRAPEYHRQYLDEDCSRYPTNRFRLQIVMKLLREYGVKTVFDVGCGSCEPMVQMLKSSIRAAGVDFSEEMVAQGRLRLKANGFPEDLVNRGDLMDRSTLPNEKFDAVTALGVVPYNANDDVPLENIRSLLEVGGRALVDFRNELFALYTFNRHSIWFFMDNLFPSDTLPADLRREVLDFMAKRFDQDPPAEKEAEFGKIASSGVSSRFHNPLTIKRLFDSHGFRISDLHFYHYHALPPIWEYKDKKRFWELSSRMELTDDWRGYFMCSMFLVDAQRVH